MNFELTHSVEIILLKKRKKGILFEFACFVFMKVLIEDNTFTSPTGDGIDILHGHPSHVKF